MAQKTYDYIAQIRESDNIDPNLYTKFNVKRGLRNADGTGVQVGLTRIGDVHGYLLDEGDKIAIDGRLYYRGIDVRHMVQAIEEEGRFGYEEAVFLLMFGSLPTREQLDRFCTIIGENRKLPRNFAEDTIMKSPSRDLMNRLARSVLTLYSYDDDPDNTSPENVLRQCIELIARFPTIVAYSYMAKKHYYDRESLIFHFPESSCNTAESILSLIRTDQQYSRLEAETLDLALILHAEHGGGNNSTFSVRLATSTDTDTYAAITTGINSLKGFKHGGANIKVMGMMKDIEEHVSDWTNEGLVADYLEKILRGEAYDGSGLIYGQGHAVYTRTDPRAVLLRDKAMKLAEEKGETDEMNLYLLIEKLSPQIFTRVKGPGHDMCSNVDFYSGFVYKMLNIPAELYTPIFAVSRVAGWCAHRMEEIVSGGKIIRPACKCVQPRLPYVPMAQRGSGSEGEEGKSPATEAAAL